MTWTQKNEYYLANGNSTICKVMLKDQVTYELWHGGKQYPNFTSAQAAKDKFKELTT